MVRLLDITEIGNIIRFICVPEGDIEKAYIVELDKTTKKVLNDIEMNVDISQAISRIFTYLNEGKPLPKKEASVWY